MSYVQPPARVPIILRLALRIGNLKAQFSERGIVIIATTCAQVNFWARLVQSFGVPPAGFSAECAIPDRITPPES